jgi:hypothetical protein
MTSLRDIGTMFGARVCCCSMHISLGAQREHVTVHVALPRWPLQLVFPFSCSDKADSTVTAGRATDQQDVWPCRMALTMEPFENLPAYYGNQMFITAFTRAPPVANLIQTSPVYTSPRPILILSTYLRLGLTSCLFRSGFPINNLYIFLFSLLHATFPTHPP